MTAIYSLHLWKLAARRPLAACSSPLRAARVLASRCGGCGVGPSIVWWPWGQDLSIDTSHHPRTCLGSARFFWRSIAYRIDFALCPVGVDGWWGRVGSLHLYRWPWGQNLFIDTPITLVPALVSPGSSGRVLHITLILRFWGGGGEGG